MNMKKIAFCFGICALMLTTVLAAQNAAADLLKKAEDNTAFFGTDFSAVYAVVQKKPGEGLSATDARMYRRDSENKWTILITGPAKDRGKGYLQYDSNIWFFDPADRRFTFSSARDRFQNTNASNSDFMPQHYARDYSIVSAEDVKLGRRICTLFTLKARVDGVDYPQLKLWVSKPDGLVRQKEDYSLSGKKMRTTLIPSYQLIRSSDGEHHIPVNMIIMDNLRGQKLNGKIEYERTMISISNVVFEKVDDSVYTKPYLEMMSAR